MKSLRNPNRKPTHPGALLQEDVLHEKKSVTAEMAIRIARAVGGAPESWLRKHKHLIFGSLK
jgi:antitoxin HigA-1